MAAPEILPPDEAVSLFYNGHQIAPISNPPDKWIAMNRKSDGTPVLVTPLPPGMEQTIKGGQYYLAEGNIEWEGDGTAPPGEVEPNPLITDIQIDAEPDAPAVGATTALTAYVYDAGGALVSAPGPLIWTTTDVTHITVEVDPADAIKETGTIIADGGAQVICTSPAGSSGSIKINIVKDETDPPAASRR
jgi:hypothetical protein